MKWNFIHTVALATAWVAFSSNHSHVVGQMQRPANTPPPSGSMPPGVPLQQANGTGFYSYSGPPKQDPMQMRPYKQVLFVIKKDGTLERIEKPAGVALTPEEMQQATEAREQLQAAVRTIKSPDADDTKRIEAKQLISKYLKAEFQWDQDGRREQVQRLETQLAELKKQLSKREDSQDKLIDLRLQLLENDATGLSFPEAWANIAIGPMATPQYPSYYSSGPVPSYAPYPNPAYSTPKHNPFNAESNPPVQQGGYAPATPPPSGR